MDVFAHVLWTNALYRSKYSKQRKKRYIAAFFGVLPDLIAFSPAFIYFVFSGIIFTPSALLNARNSWTLNYAQKAYNFSHSLVIFLLILGIVTAIGNWYFYTKDKTEDKANYKIWFYWPLLGWALHIVIDIFTHPDFYSTPFLFPLSNYRNHHGISWATPTFMAVNYTLLILVYIVVFFYQTKKNAKIEKE